jgi:hypothetical protein
MMIRSLLATGSYCYALSPLLPIYPSTARTSLKTPSSLKMSAVAMWDERYKQDAFAYGEAPNLFFQQQLDALGSANGRSILLPADGEGRNGVYAATKGWKVTSFDLSSKGRDKAMKLLANHKQPSEKINNDNEEILFQYDVGSLQSMNYDPESFDVMALIYAHFPADRKPEFHQILNGWLKPNGVVIFEAFSKAHIEYQERNPAVGGPKDVAMLYSVDEIQQYFGKQYDIIQLDQVETELSEGQFHQGLASVIRFTGKKK